MAVETAYLNTPGVTGRAEIVKIAGTIDPTTGASSSSIATRSVSYAPKGYQQIAEPASSTALTVPSGATVAVVQNNGSQPARWRDDGQAPTASTGQRIAAGGFLTYDGDLTAFRVIREAAGVTLDVLYYG